jgi:ABC-2 type transport system permease protein
MTETTRKQRRMKYGVSAAASVVILAGILVAVNLIASQVSVRADLTGGREFSISPATKSILRNLDDVVRVNAYISGKLPPEMAPLRNRVTDMLREYESYARGKLQVRVIDPGKKPELAQEAQAMGIAQVQASQLAKDQFQVTNVFLGIGVQKGDKIESIPFVQDDYTLEYDLTAAILKVSRLGEKPVIGFLTGNEERTLDKDYTQVKKRLDEQYQVRPVDLAAGGTAVPADIKTLVVPGARSVPERVKYELDQFLMRGGRIIFLLDSVNMNEQMGLRAMPQTTGLEDLLSFYGAGIKNALVKDASCQLATFSQGYMAFSVQYPYWPAVYNKGLDQNSPVTSKLESLVLPWAAPLEVTAALAAPPARQKNQPSPAPPSGNQPDVTASILARSSDKAWTESGNYDLNPQAPGARVGKPTGERYPLAVALSGQFRSFFAGKPTPARPDAATGPADPPAKDESPLTQVIVVGNSQFITDIFLRNFPANSIFLENAVDWMTSGNELISIRSRGATARPLRMLSDAARTAIKLILIIGVPALVVLLSLVRMQVRRNSRRQTAEAFQPVAH